MWQGSDIALGRYVAADSAVHRLDPRTKLASCVLLLVAILLAHHIVELLAAILLLVAVTMAAKLPPRLVWRNLRLFLWLLIITLILHLFFTPGRPIIEIPGVGWQVTWEGVGRGIFYVVRLGLVITMAALLTLTTSPLELTDGIERLIRPLRRLRVPTSELAMMLAIALRFVPTLFAEGRRIRMAQLARGARLEGNLMVRLRGVVALAAPLLISSFRRADELALALEARCYRGGQTRTQLIELRLREADYVVLAAAGAACVAAGIARWSL
ncbi:hypothetical protein AMJ39_03405 [candidate division TA06 bacterium DG_24]|uniref:Energy-coupling factor transporter transmembrane protein EcfT n=2 Tax=Bacteria division TA06 TaxID=1156500 RepID=A0A0S8GAR2_UNCT6|nr:MAG: hypothetical protein AMJ39_03405 [candidate division TA06 bacterium DG_24]KPK70133.1 MAG: hypothetical protein AMJ82_03845 [candidate division TA06 bacterium SM23_40]